MKEFFLCCVSLIDKDVQCRSISSAVVPASLISPLFEGVFRCCVSLSEKGGASKESRADALVC